MYTSIKNYIQETEKNFDSISDERKGMLLQISEYIKGRVAENKTTNLIYICTHNSRRSHFGQIWAQTMADFYGVPNVKSFSGGTEATAFNPNAIAAVKEVGFKVEATTEGDNPIYHVSFDDEVTPIVAFSKVYDSEHNPNKEFVAIMTCSSADQGCPIVFGSDLRMATTYDDPKAFDNTPQQAEKYAERCFQIATEIAFVFKNVANN
ncbi:arsenate-mycothiol transferase ArsC [Sediminitomix flava]|uniref:Arsenate reductase n=1 Tax=Sediminitomix flava TaxID=379075 RepID=A0A315ZBU7_SEDFL|nr:protein-tyrosine-phosphatase [Sediminitomix flava]PWJ42553.1 arsenate reductase [Sediminitomix flava]